MESFVELKHVVAAVRVWPEGSGSSVAVSEGGRPLLWCKGGIFGMKEELEVKLGCWTVPLTRSEGVMWHIQ
jgi:hypothetical protein